MKFSDIFKFDKMLTPLLIKIFYYIGMALSIVGGIVVIFAGFLGASISDEFSLTIVGGILGGILVIVVGSLFFRILSEALIVRFQINKNLVAIKKKIVDDENVYIVEKPLSE